MPTLPAEMSSFPWFSNGVCVVAWSDAAQSWVRAEEIRVDRGQFAAFRTAATPLPVDTQADFYLLPGFIDSHVHIGIDPYRTAEPAGAVDVMTADVAQNLQRAFSIGVTTLRDMGWCGDRSLALVKHLSREHAPDAAPRVITAGGYLTRETGHAASSGILVETMPQAFEIIDDLADRDAGFVKVMNDPVVFSERELRAIARHAKRRGLPVTVHVFTDAAAQLAVASDVDGLEHAGNYTPDTMDRIARKGIAVVTTFIAALDTVSDPAFAGADSLFPDAGLHTFRSWYSSCHSVIPELVRRGVRVTLGTDAGFPGTDFTSFRRELAALTMLGISVPTLLRGSTVSGARLLRHPRVTGVLGRNHAADFQVYDANVCVTPSALGRPLLVYLEGQEVWRDRRDHPTSD